MRKSYKDLRFTDDFMFCHVMQNNEDVAQGVIESILGYKIGGIVKLENQKSIQLTEDGHGVRFDIAKERQEIPRFKQQLYNFYYVARFV